MPQGKLHYKAIALSYLVPKSKSRIYCEGGGALVVHGHGLKELTCVYQRFVAGTAFALST